MQRLLHEFHQRKAANAVLEKVGQHARPEALAPPREPPEHAAVKGDDNDLGCPLVCVRRPERDPLQNDARGGIASPAGELVLEISAEDRLLADCGGERQQQEDGVFQNSMRKQVFEGFGVAGFHQVPEDEPKGAEQDVGDKKIHGCDSQIDSNGAQGGPEAAGERLERGRMPARADGDDAEDEPLANHGNGVAHQPMVDVTGGIAAAEEGECGQRRKKQEDD